MLPASSCRNGRVPPSGPAADGRERAAPLRQHLRRRNRARPPTSPTRPSAPRLLGVKLAHEARVHIAPVGAAAGSSRNAGPRASASGRAGGPVGNLMLHLSPTLGAARDDGAHVLQAARGTV